MSTSSAATRQADQTRQSIAARLVAARTVVPVLVVIAVTVAWVHAMPRALMIGDDLSFVSYLQHAKWPDTLVESFTTNRAKYRPVLEVVLRLVGLALRDNMYAYVALNTVVDICSALTIMSIARRLSPENVILATIAACAFVVSRFAYYNLIQVIGIMEGLALLLMLLIIRAVVIAYDDDRPRALWSTVWLGALLIFTDERFLAIVPFLIAAPLLHPARRRDGRELVAVALANCIAPVTYAAIMVLVFRQAVAIGTAGAPLHPEAVGVLTYLRSAIENMLGLNAGDPYLAAMDPQYLGLPAYLLAAPVGIPLLILLVWQVTAIVRRRARAVPMLLGLLLFIPLLLTTVVTVRQELRWLYAPFAVVVLGAVAASGRNGMRSIPAGLAALALVSSAGGALFYRQYAPNVFFIHAMAVAGALRDELQRNPAERVVLAVHHDTSLEGWAFQSGQFFQMNSVEPARVRFVNEVPEAADETGNVALLSVQMTEAGALRMEIPSVTVTPFTNARLSFEAEFGKGSINSTRAVSTPGSRGAFLFPYPEEARGTSSLTLLPGFRYTFGNFAVSRNDHLMFYLAIPLPVGTASRAFVLVRDRGRVVPVFSEIVEPSLSKPAWKLRDIPLAPFAGRTVAVSFGVDPTTPNRNAWVAFAEPSIVPAR